MSEFDKEAERERLREKFAEEEADRDSARHMSELLLQGMTMTDRHCPECGAPLFRDGDRVFCPECERQVVEDGTSGADGSQPHHADQPLDVSAAGATGVSPPESGDGPQADLETALRRSAAAAAAADDPRTTREHLEAARAAIQALRELNS